MPSKQLKKLVVDEFSCKSAQDSYKKMTLEGLWDSEKRLFLKYFKKKSNKNINLLDIGCGSGRTSFGMEKLGFNVTAVDLTPAMIKSAKKLKKKHFKNSKVKFEIGDATKLKFKDNSFDHALFSFNGLDQIPGRENRKKALDEAFRVIKPNGYFIFTSHARALKGYFWTWVSEWLRFYILKPLGFKILAEEFGDRFFKRGAVEEYKNLQFIHIPKMTTVIDQIAHADFELSFFDYRSEISKKDDHLKSSDCVFFVCRKPY